MRQSRRRSTVRLIGAVAAIVLIAGVCRLVASYIDTSRRGPVDEAQLDGLEQLAKRDTSRVAALEAERERQTDASLERAAGNEAVSMVCIAAAVLFLIGAKWSIALNDKRLATLSKIMPQHAARPKLPVGSERAPQIGPPASMPCQGCHDAGVDLTVTGQAVETYGRGKDAVIPILQAIQSHHHYLPEDALKCVCERTQITPAHIIGVSSFYKQFRRTPVGGHIVRACHGTACHVAGARMVTAEIRRHLGIAPDADTDPKRQFTIEEVACVGCCTLAPVIQIDEVTYGHVATDMVSEVLDDCLEAARTARTSSAIPRATRPKRFTLTTPTHGSDEPFGEIRIGLGSCCVAGGGDKVREALEQAVAAAGARATIKRVGCVGMCHRIPLVEAVLPGQPSSLYAGVAPEDAKEIVRRHFRAGGIRRRIADTTATVLGNVLYDGRRLPVSRLSIEPRDPPVAAFLGRQKHIATEHCGRLDPTDLDEYLRHDGFQVLERCVKGLTPEEIIDEIRRSGLRGRGGAGYPTGLKWAKLKDADGDVKYVICNGDEGDPGAFMDRMLMESFPYRIIEGMAIAAYAVGASEGYLYVRAEYRLAVQRLRDASRECEDRGFLGDNIFDTGVKLRLRIMEGAGAFVCGEETALIASIEGNRGSPRLRPPYPAAHGLWGRPTLVNNVETYATIPWIMRNGAEAFAALGTETSKGTKVFALAGKVNRGGLIEVPMGVTVREIVFEIGGGIKEGRRFKAVQIGGPSGGCIPEALTDTPVDYEALTGVGAIMGSGGLVVMDESDCMVDIARYFLSFTQDQSCGKCTFCRIGTRRMLSILDRICTGEGKKGDLQTLEQLAHAVAGGSLCGLGKTAPTPVLSTLRYFRDEYEAHLEGRCPAGKCTALITYQVMDNCSGCTICAQHCPADAIAFTPYQRHHIDADKCTRCDICRIKCPEEAIAVVSVGETVSRAATETERVET